MSFLKRLFMPAADERGAQGIMAGKWHGHDEQLGSELRIIGRMRPQ